MKIFYLPDLGEGLAEAEIREWYVSVGDTVSVDQPLVSMETAKAVVDVPSPYAGKIAQLHGKVNDIIKTGLPLISYETEEETADKGSVVGSLETSEKKWKEAEVIIGGGQAKTTTTTIKAMPAARVLAQQLHVDLSKIRPSGPKGLITAEDVKHYLNSNTAHGQPEAADDKPQHDYSVAMQSAGPVQALHGVRRTMAKTMAKAHREVVPVTIVDDADLAHLPPKTDMTAKLLQAMVAACKAEPALNAWFDGNTLERVLFDEVHIGLAVDSADGLFVPVIKNVEKQTGQGLRQIVDEYKQAIHARTILPKALQGATISLSNFGMIAGRYATPIVVPPAVAIVGCGRSREMAISHAGQITTGRMMPLSLTFDHRAVTGGEATRFLAVLIEHLQA